MSMVNLIGENRAKIGSLELAFFPRKASSAVFPLQRVFPSSWNIIMGHFTTWKKTDH